jgi:hypothetical protein
MTILFEGNSTFPGEMQSLSCNRIVISTGAQRETCGSLFRSRTL